MITLETDYAFSVETKSDAVDGEKAQPQRVPNGGIRSCWWSVPCDIVANPPVLRLCSSCDFGREG